MLKNKTLGHFTACKNASKFLLSICIPTYNRVASLRETIDSIVTQSSFRDDSCVELVILDNCSQDSTSELCKMYLELYPENFKYHRQLEPVQADINFRDVLNLASGVFVKLNNDTLIHKSYSLRYMLDFLNDAIASAESGNKVTPFFANGLIRLQTDSINCHSMDHFIGLTSGLSTYIGAFGIWRDDFHLIQNSFPELAWKNSLGHVDCLFRLFELGSSFVICNSALGSINSPFKRGGYDIGKVFVDEYLRLCRRANILGLISNRSVFIETRRSILYASRWFNNQLLYPDLYGFQFDDFFERIGKACSVHPMLLSFFYFHLRWDYLLKYFKKFIKRFVCFLKNPR